MKLEFRTAVVLAGCLAAVVAVKATDHYFKPHHPTSPDDRRYVCATDAECAEEEAAHERGEKCFRSHNQLLCWQPNHD